MKRLRSRRGGGCNQDDVHHQYLSSSDISLMTVTDRMYYNHETEPVVDGEPLVGALGEAQHRGRLIMTFNNRY
jgi:hypothetical protein